MVSGRVRLGVKWGCGQWPGWAWDQQDPVSSLGLISSFLFGEWGKGIYNWTKKLRRLRARGCTQQGLQVLDSYVRLWVGYSADDQEVCGWVSGESVEECFKMM